MFCPKRAALLVFTLLPLTAFADAVPITTRGVNRESTNAYRAETRLRPENVNDGGFGKLFDLTVDGQLYASPLFVPDLGGFPSGRHHNTLFLATMNDRVYALDADDPNATPLWSANLGSPVVISANPTLGQTCGLGNYKDIIGNVGVVGTPVIDLATQTLYVVAMTQDSPGTFQHRLHALDLATGAEKFNGPTLMRAAVAGTGYANDGGYLVFNSKFQNQRPALTLANGRVYVAFSSYCDTRPYQGWVFGYSAADLSAAPVLFNDETNGAGGRGGIWMSGGALSVDDGGSLYVTVGNGDTTAQVDNKNYGEAIIKLKPDLTVADFFIPFDYNNLNNTDADLGITSFVLLPGTHYGIAGCKAGKVYVLDQNSLGGFQNGSDSQVAQWFQAALAGHHIHGTPAVFQAGSQMWLYLWAENDALKSYAFGYGTGKFDGGSPAATSSVVLNNGMPGGMLAISQHDDDVSSGVVWANIPVSGDANQSTVTGRLLAFDARTLGTPLWSSDGQPGDALGNFAKFSPPVVSNGRIYLGTFSNAVRVYGLRADTRTSLSVPAAVYAGSPIAVRATVSGYGDGGVPVPSGAVTLTGSGSTSSGSLTLDGTGKASWLAPAQHPGVFTVKAGFTPSDGTLASSSPTLDVLVTGQPTVTTVSVPASTRYGEPTSFPATVEGTSSPATGSVSLLEGSQVLAANALDADGGAVLATNALTAGTHSLVAAYPGNTDFLASDSGVLNFTVSQGISQVTLSAPAASFPQSASEPLKVTVSGAGPLAPSGTVTVSDLGNTLGTVTLDDAGVGALSVNLDLGTHTLAANYTGDINYLPALTDGGLTLTIVLHGTTTTLAASSTDVTVGTAVVMTAHVVTDTGTNATGYVSLIEGQTSSSYGLVALDGGQAQWSVKGLAVGEHTLSATYIGDANDAESTSAPVAVTVSTLGSKADGGSGSGSGGKSGCGCQSSGASSDVALGALGLVLLLTLRRRT